jgi:hypothetical protein
MQVPGWAVTLAAEVCREYGVPPVQSLVFRMSRRRHSTGRHWKQWHDGRSRIAISAGTAGTSDQRAVLLHELAHHVAAHGRSRGRHDAGFWRIAWSLFQRHGVTSGYMEREFRYRVTAARIAVEMRVPGAVEASARIRDERREWLDRRRRRPLARRRPRFALAAGEIVRLSEEISPEYARGMLAEVVRPLHTRYEVRLLETRHRFRKGTLVHVNAEALVRG